MKNVSQNIDQYRDQILEGELDHSPRLCFRATGRALAILRIEQFAATKSRQTVSQYLFLEFMKSLLLASRVIDGVTPQNAKRVRDQVDSLARFNTQSRFTIPARSLLETTLAKPRVEKVEYVRRTLQAVLDLVSNYEAYIQEDCLLRASFSELPATSRAQYRDDIWNDFHQHFETVFKIRKRTPRPALQSMSFLYILWQNAKSSLLVANETWRIWIEWYEYRFLGIQSQLVPNYLWPRIEQSLVEDDIWTSTAISSFNGRFAELALEAFGTLASDQAELEDSGIAPSFQFSEDGLLISPKEEMDQESIKKIAVSEVLHHCDVMLEECQANSASHLKDPVEHYKTCFSEDYAWSEPISVVMRGESLRQTHKHQTLISEDSDLPRIKDSAEMAFRNLLRSHSALVALHPELTEIDRLVRNTQSTDGEQARDGLEKIIKFAADREEEDSRNSQVLTYLEQLKIAESDQGEIEQKAAVFNFTKSSASWIWKNKGKISAGVGIIGSTAYTIAQWFLSQEQWLLAYFPINSEIGVLVRAVIEFLKTMPF